MARAKATGKRKSTRQVLLKAEASTPRAPRQAAQAASKRITVQQTPRFRAANKQKAPSPEAARVSTKRGPGRPKKVVQHSLVGSARHSRSADSSREAVKKRETSNAELEGHVVSAKDIPKNRVQIFVNSNTREATGKRGPGRPPKDHIPVDEAIDNEVEDKPKRGRGIPPKAVSKKAVNADSKRKREDSEVTDKVDDKDAESARTKRQKTKAATRDQVSKSVKADSNAASYSRTQDREKIAARIAKAMETKNKKKARKFNGNRWTKLKQANGAKNGAGQEDADAETGIHADSLPSPASSGARSQTSGDEQDVAMSDATDDIPIEIVGAGEEEKEEEEEEDMGGSGQDEADPSDSDTDLAGDEPMGDFSMSALSGGSTLPAPVAVMTVSTTQSIESTISDEESDQISKAVPIVESNKAKVTTGDARDYGKDRESGDIEGGKDMTIQSAPTLQPRRSRSVRANLQTVEIPEASVQTSRSRKYRSVEPQTDLAGLTNTPSNQLRRGRSRSREPVVGPESSSSKETTYGMRQTLFRPVRPKPPTIQEEKPEAVESQLESGQMVSQVRGVQSGNSDDEVDSDDGSGMIQIMSGQRDSKVL